MIIKTNNKRHKTQVIQYYRGCIFVKLYILWTLGVSTTLILNIISKSIFSKSKILLKLNLFILHFQFILPWTIILCTTHCDCEAPVYDIFHYYRVVKVVNDSSRSSCQQRTTADKRSVRRSRSNCSSPLGNCIWISSAYSAGWFVLQPSG